MKLFLLIFKNGLTGAIIASFYCYISFYLLTSKVDDDGFTIFLSSYFINGFFVGISYFIVKRTAKKYCKNILLLTIITGFFSGTLGTLPFIVSVAINLENESSGSQNRLLLYYFGVVIISTVIAFIINRPLLKQNTHRLED